jgi:hypothetical protein
MSYDFTLFSASGCDPLATLHDLLEREERSEFTPEMVESEYQRQQLLVRQLLQQAHLALLSLDLSIQDIARFAGVTEAAVRDIFQPLRTKHEDTGLRICLGDIMIELTLPYRYTDERAREVFTMVWSFLQWFAETGDYSIYDPQLDIIIDLSADFDRVVSGYSNHTHKFRAHINKLHDAG